MRRSVYLFEYQLSRGLCSSTSPSLIFAEMCAILRLFKVERAFAKRVVLYPIVSTMITSSSGQDVIILPDVNTIRSHVQAPPELHFAGQNRRRTPLLASIFVAALFFAIPQVSQAAFSDGDMVSATNSIRQAQGLSPVESNQQLSSAAVAQANDMLQKNYFSHVSPDGTSPWSWVNQAGYQYTAIGENLADNFSDASDVVNAWLQSSTHRANLLNPNFQDVGVAVVSGILDQHPTLLVVMFFGSRTIVSSGNSDVSPHVVPVEVLAQPRSASVVVPQPAPVTSPTPPVTKSTPTVLGVTEQSTQTTVTIDEIPPSDELSASTGSQALPGILSLAFCGQILAISLFGRLGQIQVA